jgi:hypothetical protein
MNFFGFFGAIIVICGLITLRRYIQRQRWPLVQGTFDSVDVKIEGTVYNEGGTVVRPKYIQKIQYSYHGNPYAVAISQHEINAENPKLRVNPEKPSEAYLDNQSLFFSVIVISIGIILILVAIKLGVGGTE